MTEDCDLFGTSDTLLQAWSILSVAGLMDAETRDFLIDRRELLGALLEIAALSPDDPRRQQWRQSGDDVLSFRTPTPAAVAAMAALREKGGSFGYDEAGNYVRGLPGGKLKVVRPTGSAG